MSLWSPDRNPETAATDFKEATKGIAGPEHELKRRTATETGWIDFPAGEPLASGCTGTLGPEVGPVGRTGWKGSGVRAHAYVPRQPKGIRRSSLVR
jgi:hypothetical protein